MSDVLLIAESTPPALLVQQWLRAEESVTTLIAPAVRQQIETEHQVSLDKMWHMLSYSTATEEMMGRIGDWIRQHDSPSRIVICVASNWDHSADFSQRSNADVFEFISAQVALPVRFLHMALGRWSAVRCQILVSQPSCSLSRARNDWWSTLLSELSGEYPDSTLMLEVVSG
jgi:hypothetical protein